MFGEVTGVVDKYDNAYSAQCAAKSFFNGEFLLLDFDVFTFGIYVGLPKIPDLSGEDASIIYFFNPCLRFLTR